MTPAGEAGEAVRRAKGWTAQNPEKAVIASQAAGYYPDAAPVGPSASRVRSLGFDRRADVAEALECSLRERIESGQIETTKTLKELVRLYYRKIE